jgi:hypothetical protein
MEDYDGVSHDSDSDDGVPPPTGLTSGFGAGLTTGELRSRQLQKTDTVLYTPYDRHAAPARVPIQCDPGVIDFASITPGILYVMTFSVRNSSSHGQRIRIKAPASMYFALNYTPTGVIAPGIELRAEIECQIPENVKDGRFTDKIVVSMGDHKLDVPLIATKIHANVTFNKYVNFGYVSEGQTVTSKVEFFNNDHELDGAMTLLPSEDSRVTYHPLKFTVKPRQSIEVEMTYQGQDLGPWREMVEVITDGAYESQYMDCSVQTVDQKIALLADNNGGIMDSAAFGSLFYGQETELRGFLVNTGPQQLSFSIAYQDEEGEPSKDPDAAKQLSGTLNVTPKQGIIKPFSQVEMTLKFTPMMPPPSKGFLHEYQAESREKKVFQRRAFIDCIEMNQRLNLSLEGDAQSADVAVSPSMLRFGSCPVHDRRDILVNLVNKSEMRTPYSFQNIAHFKITPNRGILEPFERTSVVASFTPSQLGIFKKTCKIEYCDGLTEDEVKFVAEADRQVAKTLVGGPTALPEDFERVRKFVDPEEVAIAREAKRNGVKKAAPETRFESELAKLIEESADPRDNLYETDDASAVSLVSMHPLKVKKNNQKMYNNYITKSYEKRKNKKQEQLRQSIMMYRGVDPADPTSYDISLEHDLDEPDLRIPRGGEKLWLADSADNKRARPVLDENRLILKKFSKTPATQAEMRDCNMELDPDNMALITSSHKIMNFGRVCVGSSTTKSFSVTNELAGSCMIKLEELEPEMRQSKPDCQVIPAGAVAGFDMSFTSKTLGEYKKSFSWNLNGQHVFRVVVLAEVVPIECDMSKSELHFEFPDSSTEGHMAQDVMLKNTGNSVAEFLWGSSGAFECKPDKGSINPGQTAIISVVWTPAFGRRNEEELGLHIPGGVDQTLKVTGTVYSTKMAFDKPKLSFGTVAVGTEKEMTIRLKNQGAHSGVYFVDGLDERQGIRINPDRAVVPAGGSVEIAVTVAPKQAMSYDSVQVQLAIRGLKPMVLKFCGESIIPQIEVGEQSIEIPNIAIGSEYRAPLALTNESEIPACLVIDLKKYQDFMPTIHDMENGDQDSTRQFDAHHNCIELIEDKSNPNAMPSNTWKITLQPKSTLEGFLLFMPTVVKNYNFKIPIDIQGIEGDKSLHCDLSASSSKSRLGLSTSIVDLGDCVVSRDPMNRASYFSEVVFKNIDPASGFSYEIKERQAADAAQKALAGEAPTFFVSPTRGDLAPGNTAPIRLTFQPQKRGKYVKILDVYITGQPSADVPYFSILCRGSGVYPSLAFSARDVVLPTVPLDITSRASFDILNQGYTQLQVDYKLSPSIIGKVEVEFPDGNEIGVAKTSVRVNVTSKSHNPISWSGVIEFMDKSGEKFGMTVSGCSDNCVFTNNDYLRSHSKLFGFIGLENQPALYMLKSQMQFMRAEEAKRKDDIRKARQAARQNGGSVASKDESKASSKKKKHDEALMVQDVSPDEDVMDEGFDDPAASFNDKEARFCLKWLNRNVMDQGFDEERFPHCIIESDGSLVLEAIESLCGRKLAEVRKIDQEPAPGTAPPPSAGGGAGGATAAAAPHAHHEKVDPASAKAAKMLKKYRALLTVLTSYGALVTHVNAMNLLGLDDHVQAQITHAKVMEGTRLTPNMLSELKDVWKANWLLNCKQAWLDVLFQSIKVFVLSRVNYDELIKLPGFPAPNGGSSNESVSGSKDAKGKEKKAKKSKAPAEFGRSNVYTQSECALLAWLSHHVNQAADLKDEGAHSAGDHGFGIKKRLVDFEGDLADLLGFCQVFHSHVPETAHMGGCLVGYTAIDRQMEREALFNKFVDALDGFRISFGLEESELVSSRRSIILMILHLYLNVPNMIPKGKIEFQGVLGKPVQKTVELRNPSKKPVRYQVTLQGSDDFVLSSDEVDIPPHSHCDYLITLNSKFFEPTSAKVTFWGVRQHGLAGRSIVFHLTSKMTSRAPVQSTKLSMGLFEMKSVEMVIGNPFPKDVTMPIKLFYHHSSLTVDDMIAIDSGKGRGFPAPGVPVDRSDEDNTDEDFEIIQNFRNPIWSAEENIQLTVDGEEPRHLVLNCLPFMMGTYTCHIVFIDKRFGEFCHELVVEVGLPKPSEHLQFDAICQDTAVKMLSVSAKNQAFEKALTMIIDNRMGNSQKKQRARQLLSGMLASPVDDEATSISTFNIFLRNGAFKVPKTIPFLSEYIPFNPASTGAKPTTAKKISKTELDGEAAPRSGPNVASINFCPEKPGFYDSSIVVSSKFNRYDVRCFDLHAGVKMPNKKLVIEFNGPSLHKLEQEIPILNETDDDWNLTASVSGRGFAGPKTLAVGKKGRGVYLLNFTAPAVGTFEGTLTLKSNNEGGDTFEYTLVGNSTAPLATEHLVFKCKARHNKKFTIPVSKTGKAPKSKASTDPNARMMSYDVSTDLQYVFGAEVAEVPVSGGEYEFSVMCPVSGVMSGSISFTDKDGFTIWYTLDIEVSAPMAESTIVVESQVRKACSVEIGLENPLDEDLEFVVNIDGDGVFGDTTYSLPSKSSTSNVSAYELIYSPLLAGRTDGRISFVNDKVGEIWYQLNLMGLEADPVVIEPVEAMLGATATIEIPIENPLSEEVVLLVETMGSDHFTVKQDTVTLDPFMQTTFDVFFRPSALSEPMQGQVTLSGDKFGSITFIVSGSGLLPGVMPDVEIVSPLNEFRSHVISFRNPFNTPLPIDVSLDNELKESDNAEPVFKLMMKQSEGVVVAPKALCQLSLSFSPSHLGEYATVMQVRAASGPGGGMRNFTWAYPIKGLVEAGTPQYMDVLRTACKTTLIREVELYLRGMPPSSSAINISDFSLEVVNEKAGSKAQLTRVFRVDLMSVRVLSGTEKEKHEANYAVVCRVLFEPLRTLTAEVALVLDCRGVGRWRAQMEIEATEPLPDDRIHLIAPVTGSDMVKFRLSNRFLGISNFTARFAPGSSPHFRVSPTAGALAPFGSNGTEFSIMFSPTTYGIRELANLVIETDDAQWNYEVTGAYPDVTIDKSLIESKIDNKR